MKLGVPHYNRENTSMNPSTQMNQSNGTNFFPQQAQQTTQLAEAGSENTADSVCDEAIMQAKQAFVNHGIYGPQSMSPTDTRTGGFEASYNPVNEDLQITVRGKTRFMNGLVIGANGIVSALESDLATLARVLNYIGDEVLTNTIVSNYYSWSEEQKENARLNFADRIAEMVWIWQDEPWLMFRIDEPCWDDITAMLNMNIDVQSEGVAAYST
ncbi:MAG TPA: hypothetical protein VEP89_06700, partial [Draconibacterium sp.]|nr:hypothetical protein [Draconibacterium sp.]